MAAGKNKTTKFHSNVEWLLPFYDSVSDLVDHKKIALIMGYTIKPPKTATNAGSLIKYSNKKRFNLTILLGDHSNPKHKDQYLPDVLDTFAHELAHAALADWVLHTPEHLLIQTKILARFTKVLTKQKICPIDITYTRYLKKYVG